MAYPLGENSIRCLSFLTAQSTDEEIQSYCTHGSDLARECLDRV